MDGEKNPSGNALRDYKKKHWGIEADAVHRVNQPGLPRELVEMGKLRELGVELGDEKYSIAFPPTDEAILAYTLAKSERLYLVLPTDVRASLREEYWNPGAPSYLLREAANEAGGRQAKFRYPQTRVQILGKCTWVIYLTRKKQDFEKDGRGSNYHHTFGEELFGLEPFLCISSDGRLHLAGGTYRVLDDGIVN
jgi:hypothetical protein